MNLIRSVSLCLIFFTPCVSAFDEHYRKESEIPEPLFFDLVRRINSDKGELEVNTLVTQQGADEMKGIYVAPEIEYAFANGKAVEVELPTQDGKIKTYKGALQFQLPDWIGDVTGTQIIHETVKATSDHETTLLLLAGKRVGKRWSVFSMLGNRFVYGDSKEMRSRRWRELPIANVNVFYDYADVFDLGLEINVKGVGASYQDMTIMPQIHALLARDFKIQMGFGTAFDGYEFSPVTAFRLIKEFNDGK